MGPRAITFQIKMLQWCIEVIKASVAQKRHYVLKFSVVPTMYSRPCCAEWSLEKLRLCLIPAIATGLFFAI